MNFLSVFVAVASIVLACVAIWVMRTDKIHTGVLCTIGFGLVATGLFGVSYFLIEQKDSFYRPMSFVVSGGLLICISAVWNLHVKRLPVLRRVSDYVGLLNK